MLKLKDLILGTNLDEGLIRTYPIDASVDILNRDSIFKKKFNASKFQSWIVVEFHQNSLEWNDIEESHLFEDYLNIREGESEIRYLLNKLNSLGYVPSFYQILHNGTSIERQRFAYNKLLSAISNRKGTVYRILFQAKYGTILFGKDVPKVLYHAADSKYDNKISRIGLIPRGGERYDDRIYVVIDISSLTKIFIDNIKAQKHCASLTLYKIETSGLDLILYSDDEYRYRGFYIKRNISPENIELLRHL